ncbi:MULTISPECIES: hypothetical protein [unclassified Mesorhizobium]|uniref:hypothetical protein n=1 Tax=unclassified Mesorhizobium TaxID=325217 RepID=UPI001FE10168|nr:MULTISPECIES: hypothetical protein [unclassified Mesorhizobium]
MDSFKGAAKRITDLDIPRIGATIGVGEDEIHVFMDVEAAGSGFDRSGRPNCCSSRTYSIAISPAPSAPPPSRPGVQGRTEVNLGNPVQPLVRKPMVVAALPHLLYGVKGDCGRLHLLAP